jgi:putative DNA primase/helicase
MARLTKEQIKQMADRAEARSHGAADDSDAEWERGFDETCDKAWRERSREIYEAEIERLALLPLVEWALECKPAAKRLDMPVSTLEKLVRARRPKKTAKAGTDFLPHWKVELWPEPVNGTALLDELRRYFTRYAALPKHADAVLALWTLHTWVFDCFDITPYLAITSPTKRCGKSLLMTLLHWLCCRGKKNDSMSKAAIYRSVESERPTLILDEVSWVLDLKDERQGILCGGFERLGHVEVCEGEGANIVVRRYATFCPKAFGLIGKLTSTLMDRSIEIAMQRKTRNDKVKRLCRRDSAEHTRLRQRCLCWANDNRQTLTAAPTIIDALNDRAFDIWEPLLAIAERVGGDRPRLATEAAIALSGDGGAAEEISVELLRGIEAEFNRTGSAALTTKTLIAALCADEEQPWATYNKGKPISDRQVARLLRPFAILSNTVHQNETGVPQAKGYRRAWFADAFERYLPLPRQLESSQAYKRTSADEMGMSSDFCIRTESEMYGCEKREKPANDGHLYACTDKNPETQVAAGNGDDDAAGFPPVCDHCRAPATADAPVLPCAVEGETFLLHPACRKDWMSETDDLGIPEFLRRAPEEKFKSSNRSIKR